MLSGTPARHFLLSMQYLEAAGSPLPRLAGALDTLLATYLITGIAGFIGSHLADALLSHDHQVRGLDNFSTGRRENIAHLTGRIDLREADLCDQAAVADACAGVDFILHQAALPSIPRSISDPRTSHETNLDGTFNLLEAARLAGVRRVVFAASSSAYGNQPGFPRLESMRPQPIAPYAVQKVAAELYMQSYWQVFGLETVCLRYFNIFGPRQDPDSPYSAVIARFIHAMLQGRQPQIFGDGEQGRDFTYIDNAVQANLRAVEADATAVAGKVFNVATGRRHSLNQTFALLAEAMQFTLPPIYSAPRAGDIRDSFADISAAAEALRYSPEVSFAEGLRRTVAWYRQQHRQGSL